eukprot:m.21996 g.21996  ORF g.21996 m.21996 type:complete len:586 (+) comp5752_c0_seq2:352-2109(+)
MSTVLCGSRLRKLTTRLLAAVVLVPLIVFVSEPEGSRPVVRSHHMRGRRELLAEMTVVSPQSPESPNDLVTELPSLDEPDPPQTTAADPATTEPRLEPSTHAATIPGFDEFVAPLKTVLTAEGVKLIAAAFKGDFKVEIEGACRYPTAHTFNSSAWANACLYKSPDEVSTDVLTGMSNSAEWCTKFAAEYAIPAIIERSPWARRPGGTANVTIVEYHRKIHWGENVQRCADKMSQTYSGSTLPPWRAPHLTFFTMMDDHSHCDIQGRVEADWVSPGWARKSPMISVSGERWSRDARSPCYNNAKDLVVPTPNMIVPSTENTVLEGAIHEAPKTPRHSLAFMLRGNAYPGRDHLMRLWKGDDELNFVEQMPKQDVVKTMLTTKFCIQADGQAPWSPRLVEAIAAGCVPVLVSNTLLPPFQRTVKWSAFSVRLRQSQAVDLKHILQRLVQTGEYDRLFRNVLKAVEMFRYYLNEPTRGAGPLVVAEMIAVASRETPAPQVDSPWGWYPPLCSFLEDCPGGCDDDRGKGRAEVIAHPCDPVSFSDCHRIPEQSAGRLAQHIHRAWGAPPSTNVTVCTQRGNGYKRAIH